MTLIHILILAIVQGAAELLPVSSSAHVIVAERLMGLDPSSPEMTFLLVMLHTGTMFAVILYFWKQWRSWFFGPEANLGRFVKLIALATAATGVLGLVLKAFIEKVILHGHEHQEIEAIFGNLPLVASALFCAGVLICVAGMKAWPKRDSESLTLKDATWIGAVQGVCLPFRGFSRSGATISTALIRGVPKRLAEEFSFALALVLTPPVIAREAHRLMKAHDAPLHELFAPGLLGMVFAFGAGLLALRWLSSWLEKGNWKYFGIYCVVASLVIFALNVMGTI